MYFDTDLVGTLERGQAEQQERESQNVGAMIAIILSALAIAVVWLFLSSSSVQRWRIEMLPPVTPPEPASSTGDLDRGTPNADASSLAGHASPKTTKFYDRTADTVTVDESSVS